MSPSETDRRRALEARLMNTARDLSIDVNRLRRQVVFQRIVARLAADRMWILKGGFALEARLRDRARATQDIDLVRRSPRPDSPGSLHLLLTEALDRGPGEDGFTFQVSPPKAMLGQDEEPSTWRFTVEARMAGRTFQRLKLDVNLIADEVEGGVELLDVVCPVPGAGLGTVTVIAVDVAQHAAEKYHAIGRLYAGSRPSTRVKDLADLVLLIDAGLLPDPRLAERLRHVYAQRDGIAPPGWLPELPQAWAVPYAQLATELDLSCADLASAAMVVGGLLRAVSSEPEPRSPRTEESST